MLPFLEPLFAYPSQNAERETIPRQKKEKKIPQFHREIKNPPVIPTIFFETPENSQPQDTLKSPQSCSSGIREEAGAADIPGGLGVHQDGWGSQWDNRGGEPL